MDVVQFQNLKSRAEKLNAQILQAEAVLKERKKAYAEGVEKLKAAGVDIKAIPEWLKNKEAELKSKLEETDKLLNEVEEGLRVYNRIS